MDISKYAGYFHDGSIYEIYHENNQMVITMGSVEIVDDDVIQEIALSKDSRIMGKLHIEGIHKMSNSEEISETKFEKFEMFSKNSDVFHFEIIKNTVVFHIIWVDYSRTDLPTREVGFSVVEIEAEKIWWENLPDMIVDE